MPADALSPMDLWNQALVGIQARTPATSSAGHYGRIVAEHALLRRLIGAAGEIAELGYDLPDDVTAAVDRAEALLFAVARRHDGASTRLIKDLLDDGLARLEVLYERGDAVTGLRTGYLGLDELLSGLQPSTLNIVGARPAMGKTAWAVTLATHVAVRESRPVLFFSLEMGHHELTERVLAGEARIDTKKLRTGRLTETEWAKISHAIGRIAEAPLYIDDSPRVTVMEVRAKARRLKAKLGDLGLVVIDYLQLMSGTSSRPENRQIEVSEMSRGLKVLAREMEVPVVALSQLNRGLELRADKRPMLADLRESGGLEQDADVVMFVYRDEVYHPDTNDKGQAEVIVAKHRAGPTGLDRLAFLSAYARFDNLARGM